MDVDAVMLGSGLTESIAAAALSKAGYKVAHIDINTYYGGDDASLTIDELVSWADERAAAGPSSSSYVSAQRTKFTSISRSGSSLPQSRQYSISLSPTIIPSVGPLIDLLIASGVSRYGGFKLLEKVAIYTGPGTVKPVPGSKEDVFKNKELSLLDKRRLMRYLMFAAGDFEGKKELEGKEEAPFTDFLREVFSLDGQTAAAIAYALAFCVSAVDSTLPSLQRIRKYLRSTGRYGPSPFLVGHYGGLGEIAQGFCRTAAVSGAAYILGHNVSSIEAANPSQEGRKYKISLENLDESITCDLLIASPGYPSPQPPSTDQIASNSHPIARAIIVIDRPLSFSSPEAPSESTVDPSTAEEADLEEAEQIPPKQELDTALLVFPPSSLKDGSSKAAANVLVTGEGSMSTPKGRWILYLSLPLLDQTASSAEALLRPYLDATLGLAVPAPTPTSTPTPAEPLFTLFYIEHPDPSTSDADSHSSSVLRPASTSPLLPEQADSATTGAEALFWRAVEGLKAAGRRPRRRVGEGEDASEEEVEVEGFWPPLDVVDDPSEDW
ncbi:GDP dissociation inhibitor-domain-containing protein [Fomitopsis serialis]|uniref:GDP dissociation inhibitor-domain-containing protein n=1 Tax=Fomitopsis serialis TaxID=139415 RepID=UPI002008BB8D|nr:GDP dissociation inhibitor-domain-containing protein [Neoantrodia serialis]KAH9928951.1 GDP dissociation inhibitor-domain-containing protein [Neoantrodia serialis]